MSFEWTEGQKKAMAMVESLMKERPPMPAVLTGFAGTGKTTMIKAIASQYGEPMVLAPTGKAAVRVQEVTGLPVFLYEGEGVMFCTPEVERAVHPTRKGHRLVVSVGAWVKDL